MNQIAVRYVVAFLLLLISTNHLMCDDKVVRVATKDQERFRTQLSLFPDKAAKLVWSYGSPVNSDPKNVVEVDDYLEEIREVMADFKSSQDEHLGISAIGFPRVYDDDGYRYCEVVIYISDINVFGSHVSMLGYSVSFQETEEEGFRLLVKCPWSVLEFQDFATDVIQFKYTKQPDLAKFPYTGRYVDTYIMPGTVRSIQNLELMEDRRATIVLDEQDMLQILNSTSGLTEAYGRMNELAKPRIVTCSRSQMTEAELQAFREEERIAIEKSSKNDWEDEYKKIMAFLMEHSGNK